MTDHSMKRDDDAALPVVEVFRAPNLFQTLFWKPRFLADDPVMSCVPFLFWLTAAIRPRRIAVLGCGSGAAHFAFCQTVEGLDLKARVTGTGFWGDGAAIPADHVGHQEMLYEGISDLRACTSLDDAMHAIGKGGCDLLFVDLAALPEGAALPADDLFDGLSPAGTLVLHGIDGPAHAPDPDWLERLMAGTDHLRMTLDRDLIVLTRKGAPGGPLRVLLDRTDDGWLGRDAERVFRSSGQGLGRAARIETQDRLLESMRRELAEIRTSHDALAAQGSDADRLRAELEATRETLARTESERDTERDTRIRETAILNRIAEDMRQQLASRGDRDDQAARIETERAARFRETAALERQVVTLRNELSRMQGERDALVRQMDDFLQSTSWRITGPLRSVKSALSRTRGR